MRRRLARHGAKRRGLQLLRRRDRHTTRPGRSLQVRYVWTKQLKQVVHVPAPHSVPLFCNLL